MKKSIIKKIILENTKHLIHETYVNVFTPNDKKKYVDVVWDIMQLTYKPLGGFGSAASKDELIHDSSLWKLVRKDGKIIAAAIYKDQFGRKAIAKGSDGTPEGKIAIKKIYADDITQDRSWGEFSGPAEKLMLKLGGVPIPNTVSRDILTKLGKNVTNLNPDGFHYTRSIMGTPHEKIMISGAEKSKQGLEQGSK